MEQLTVLSIYGTNNSFASPSCFIEKVHKRLQSISENPNLDDVYSR